MIVYLDTSAMGKLLVVEAETEALGIYLDNLAARADTTLVSATLTETELRRMAVRIGATQSAATDMLSRVTLLDMDRGLYREAGVLTGAALRSLDALHIAAALQAAVDQFVTYDIRQMEATRLVGLSVYSPS